MGSLLSYDACEAEGLFEIDLVLLKCLLFLFGLLKQIQVEIRIFCALTL